VTSQDYVENINDVWKY